LTGAVRETDFAAAQAWRIPRRGPCVATREPEHCVPRRERAARACDRRTAAARPGGA
jgi:hypothetical protein